MAGADAGAGVAVEVLVEQHKSRQCGSDWNSSLVAKHRPASVLAAQEEARQPLRQQRGDLIEREHLARAGRALDRNSSPK